MTKAIEVDLSNGLGNRMFQYAFARSYAERHGFELHTPPCMLQRIFQIDDPPAVDNFPLVAGDHSRTGYAWGVGDRDGEWGIRLTGQRQHQEELTYTRSDAKRWFRLRPEMEELVRNVPSMEVVANLRRGDYAYACNPFVVISEESYLDACDEYGIDKTKVYFLDGETHYRIPEIPVESPWVNLDATQQGKMGEGGRLDFLPDLVLMMRAKVLLRSNSTFAWWAATLGDSERVFSPDIRAVTPAGPVPGTLYRAPQHVPFVEGNFPAMCWGWPFLSELHLKP
jgi:hypothetical protein